MATKQWVGTLKGARFGPLYWREPDDGDGAVSVTTADGKTLSFISAPEEPGGTRVILFAEAPNEPGERIPIGSLAIDFRSDTSCNGTWELNDGSKGIFDLDIPIRSGSADVRPAQGHPAQLWNKEVRLGAITLYRTDLDRLIAEMSTFVLEPAVTLIRATEAGQVILLNAEAYLARGDRPDVLEEMTISREEIVASGFRKVVTVSLSDSGHNNIMVSSPDELWTAAVAQRLSGFMQQFASTLTALLRAHGLSVNAVILLCLVIVLPDYALRTRMGIAVVTIALMLIIQRFHKFLRFARVYLDPERTKNPYSKEIPSAILATIFGILVTALSSLQTLIDRARDVLKKIFHFIALSS